MGDFKFIIHIVGLPGAGKTTLSKKLARKLKFPVYRIGEYHSKFLMTIYGEADAWLALFRDLSKRKWRNCILETTGLNCRETFLRAALPRYGIITIKLEAKRKILYERVREKKKNDQGGEWLFSSDYKNKNEFIAVKHYIVTSISEKHVVVIYREQEYDGLVITAFMPSKPEKIIKKGVVWNRPAS